MELNELIEAARNIKYTQKDHDDFIKSFAYGNVKLSNPAITREDIDRAFEDLRKGD
jgi:D-arabinose 1-dehydrogenase-like Zn-dependent alcohol dehydrogenase